MLLWGLIMFIFGDNNPKTSRKADASNFSPNVGRRLKVLCMNDAQTHTQCEILFNGLSYDFPDYDLLQEQENFVMFGKGSEKSLEGFVLRHEGSNVHITYDSGTGFQHIWNFPRGASALEVLVSIRQELKKKHALNKIA